MSGVNFQYLGCVIVVDFVDGDYGKWLYYEFKLFEFLCGLFGSIFVMFVVIVQGVVDGMKDFCVEVNVVILDYINNCGVGLMIDNLVIVKFCDGWFEGCGQQFVFD